MTAISGEKRRIILRVRCCKVPTYTEGVLHHQEFSICPSLTQNIGATLEVNQKMRQ